MRTKLTPAFVQKARAEHKAGLSPGESHLDDVVEAAAEKLRKALAAKSAAKLRGEIERIAQGLDDVLLARRERPRSSRAAEQRYELAAVHSITSSARAAAGAAQ